MYLKKITINGFKSYTQQTVVEQLDPKHNVVVGRNGSGKSNFFSAIEFVLSDEYNNLRQSERVGLINKGSSKARSDNGFVELLFEKKPTSSETKATEMNEVRICRTISATKDQYKLNGRNATRKEVVEMLDSLGLSTCNPYYIIKQGKINQLATARPSELLQVLLEVGGIRVYDDKLLETMKLMQDADKCLMQTRIEFSSLTESLKLLSKERKELETFEQLEKKHRVLYSIVLEKGHTDSVVALQDLNENEKSWEEKQRQLALQMTEAMEKTNVLKRERTSNKIALRNALSKHSCLNDKHLSLHKQKAQLELQIKDMENKLACESGERKNKEKQLDIERAEIAQMQQDLKSILDNLKLTQERKYEYKKQLLKKKEACKEVMDKKQRGKQFANIKDRNHFLEQEIGNVLSEIHKVKDSLKGSKNEHNIVVVQLENEKQSSAQEQQELALLMKKEHSYKEHLNQINSRLQESNILLEEQFAEDKKNKEDLLYYKMLRADQEQTVRKLIGTGAFQGLQSVNKILGMLKSQDGQDDSVVRGYYGQLSENFHCEETIYRAVETIAGNKLHYHIVESDVIANEIIALCNKHRLPGQYNFLPLNRLNMPQAVNHNQNGIQPLIGLLKYEPKYEIAFQSIFGKALLCDGLDIAANVNRQYRLSCVTKEGDLVANGAITGGYRAPSSSKIRQMMSLRDLNEKITLLETQLSSTSKHIRELQKLIENYEMQQAAEETKLHQLQQNVENIQIRVRTFPERCRKLEKKSEEKESQIRALTTELEILAARKNSFQHELSTPLVRDFSDEDDLMNVQLHKEIRKLKHQYHEAFNVELEVQNQKHKLENKLNSILIPKRDMLIAALEQLDCDTNKQQMELYQQQQNTLTTKIDSLDQDIKSVDEQMQEMMEKDKRIAQELENWNQSFKNAEEQRIIKHPKQLLFETQKQKLEQEVNRYAEKINALGVLPVVEPIFQKMPLPKLMKQLEQTKKQMSKFSSVNKAAFDEHTRVSQALKALNQKLKQTENSRAMHETSIQHLRAQRVDCIEKIFNRVNTNFSELFSKFVPTGSGKLILEASDNTMDQSNVDERRNEDVPDRYTGLGLQVSFMTSQGVLNGMNALSGGQKTLVAIALILAIQKYNPAPFYLFDEIDQALDTGHRRVIADEIHTLSKSSQFITITFRQELLKHADKYFGVRYLNNISHIGPVSKQQAFEFIVDSTIRE